MKEHQKMNAKETERKTANLSPKGIPEGGDVLLIVSPTIWTAAPIGGIHILQAACREAGINTKVLYTNFHYSRLIGAKLHETVALEDHYMLEERLFAAAAFNIPFQGQRMPELFKSGRVPDHLWPENKPIADEFISIIAPLRKFCLTVDWEYLELLTVRWVQTMTRDIAKKGFPIVGCSTTHGGLAAAIALLNSIKKVSPKVITVIGGGLCEAEMAEGIRSLKSGIDYIFSGEADVTFPGAVKKILAGHLPKEEIIYGEEVTDLDACPLPDYREYFEQKKHFFPDNSPPGSSFMPGSSLTIPYETSRGCWYNRCTFCGFKEETNRYCKKSPDNVLKELKQLVCQYNNDNIYITDNMISPDYYHTLFPRLKEELPSLRFFYEVKANITLDQVLTLRDAGTILLQPGIESLSPSLLKRMDKGLTVRENIALLRYARSVNLDLKWHLLFGFPGDQAADYEEMLNLIPLIRHLQPPRTMLPVRICRNSRYHRSPREFGIFNLRPAEFHKETLPDHAHLEKLAYLFTGDYEAHSFNNPELLLALGKEFQAWTRAWAAYKFLPLDSTLPTLHITRETSNGFVLQDTRGIPGKPEKMILHREQVRLLLAPHPPEVSSGAKFKWALDAGLGVLTEGWFIPLATADAALLREFEHKDNSYI